MSASMFIVLIPIILSFNAKFLEAQSGHLPEDELNALKEIADQLGKKDWDFSVNPCDKKFNQMKPIGNGMPEYVYNNSISCNCSFPAGICHVDAIVLKAQSLQGVLPPSLAKLPLSRQLI